ncbi:ABC transporter substrate-binding protein [Anaerocolumna sp.]|uniref:ABC transporter substrate-binding protein n=1 Tax=Anaerocolumna sp. TaxID=2041569 RepID=UPI0028B0A262|nr:ABC transporter substrate-binding protein [Anaerocolumna sp.]
MKKLFKTLLVLGVAFGLVACSGKKTEAPETKEPSTEKTQETTPEAPETDGAASNGDTIKIGALQDITGKTATLGKMIQAGAQYAIDEINAAGGVNGKKLELITRDTTGDVTEAINAFTLLATQDGVSAIIGPPVANIGLAIAPLSEQYNVPILGFAIDTAVLQNKDGVTYKNMFLFQPSDDQQGAIMAKYALDELGSKKIGAIYRSDNAYSLGLVDGFKSYLAESGSDSKIVQEVQFTATDTDFSTMLMKLMNAGADVIYAPNYTQELITIAQQARAVGYTGTIIMGLDAAPPFASLAGAASNNIIYINNITESEPKVAEIMEKYKAETGADATNKFFLGYDVVNILADTITEVGEDSVAIRDAVEKLTGFEGLTGIISINPENHQPQGLEMYIHEIKDGESVMIKQYSAE